jgi:tetratricopeptide (TPR) repeat protein
MMEDPVAVGLAEEALARCRTLKPVPITIEAKLLSILGTAHNRRHEYAKAIEAYEQAVLVSSAFPDLRGLSYVYGNLSIAYQETGQYAEAAHYARRSMALYETLNDRLNIAIAENNLAVLIHKQGDVIAALRHAETSLRAFEEIGVEPGRAHVLLTVAELEFARSGYSRATRFAEAAVEMTERTGEVMTNGEAHHWLARIAAAMGDVATTDAEFAVAFQRWNESRAVDWLARGHAVYAEILEARGELSAANRHLRHALTAVGPRESAAETVRIAIA